MRNTIPRFGFGLALAMVTGVTALSPRAMAQRIELTMHQRDRGVGVPVSIFGIYIERGQLLVFPFYAYARDHNLDNQPAKWGYGLNDDFRCACACSVKMRSAWSFSVLWK